MQQIALDTVIRRQHKRDEIVIKTAKAATEH